MWRVIIRAIYVASLLSPVATITRSAQAQYDQNTCSGNFNYCMELARRQGQPGTECQSAYQECMRRGEWSRRSPHPIFNATAGRATISEVLVVWARSDMTRWCGRNGLLRINNSYEEFARSTC
jgi:hypothetical protein